MGSTWAILKGQDICVGEADFSGQGRALIMSENAGLLRIYAQRRSGRLLGAQMGAPGGNISRSFSRWRPSDP
ncbi:MAG: hypothetical protein KGL74_11355 [Elusimicrobia bacterium]|nr:hypothetical protein [Elusimicrobiota bacterium]MDE2511708.1 hypothetical protein [Elusimicrobiota bacterium]